MASELRKIFEYIAFDRATGTALAHAATAIDALSGVDRLAPDASIDVIDSRCAGKKIWDKRMNRVSALSVIDAPSTASFFLFVRKDSWTPASIPLKLILGEVCSGFGLNKRRHPTANH